MVDATCVPLIDRNGDVVAESWVDPPDSARVLERNWSLHPRGYAQANIDGRRVLLHRFVLDMPSVGKGRGSGVYVAQVDHIDHDKLNNRRANLRVVTNQQNHENRAGGYGASPYRGVSRTRGGKWMARYGRNGKGIYVGQYVSEYDAAVAAWEARRANLPHCVEDRPVRVT